MDPVDQLYVHPPKYNQTDGEWNLELNRVIHDMTYELPDACVPGGTKEQFQKVSDRRTNK